MVRDKAESTTGPGLAYVIQTAQELFRKISCRPVAASQPDCAWYNNQER